MYSCGLLHMDKKRLGNQLEPIYNSSVPIQDMALKTSLEWWMIDMGGERESKRSMLAVRHDDADEAQFSNSGYFGQGHEWDVLHGLVRFQAHQKFLSNSECYSADLLLAWSTAFEFPVLEFPEVASSLRFLQPPKNILKHLITALWSTAPLPFAQELLLVAFQVLSIYAEQRLRLLLIG